MLCSCLRKRPRTPVSPPACGVDTTALDIPRLTVVRCRSRPSREDPAFGSEARGEEKWHAMRKVRFRKSTFSGREGLFGLVRIPDPWTRPTISENFQSTIRKLNVQSTLRKLSSRTFQSTISENFQSTISENFQSTISENFQSTISENFSVDHFRKFSVDRFGKFSVDHFRKIFSRPSRKNFSRPFRKIFCQQFRKIFS